MSTQTLERYGRRTIWFLIAYVAFAGVVAHYFSPIHYKITTMVSPEYADQDVLLGQSLPLNDLLHRVLGVTLLVLGALQFNADLRRRRPEVHRWIGRTYLLLGLIVATCGLVFGFVMPFAGVGESAFVVCVATGLLFILSRAWLLVRRRDFVHHREWMIRGFALFMFIAVQRIIILPFWLLTDWSHRTIFDFTAWMAVIIVLIAAETWINVSRAPARTQGAAA